MKFQAYWTNMVDIIGINKEGEKNTFMGAKLNLANITMYINVKFTETLPLTRVKNMVSSKYEIVVTNM